MGAFCVDGTMFFDKETPRLFFLTILTSFIDIEFSNVNKTPRLS